MFRSLVNPDSGWLNSQVTETQALEEWVWNEESQAMISGTHTVTYLISVLDMTIESIRGPAPKDDSIEEKKTRESTRRTAAKWASHVLLPFRMITLFIFNH